ncbi:MAG: Rossmann-like domain-containing protein [Promethearchaeota archaeon]
MVSEILRDSYEILTNFYGDNPPGIKSLIRGFSFIGVQLTDMNSGIAFAERDWPHEMPLFLEKTDKDLPNVYALAKKAYEGQGMEICYGLAVMSALTTGMLKKSDKYELIEDAEIIELWKDHFQPEDVVAMVGAMPLFSRLKPYCSRIILLDMHADRYSVPEDVELADSAEDLAEADVLIATGSSLVYHSTEELLEKTPKARLKAVVGPSVTLPPEPFWDRGVQFVGGAMVEDERFIQALVAENVMDDWETFLKKRKKLKVGFGKGTGFRKIGFLKP